MASRPRRLAVPERCDKESKAERRQTNRTARHHAADKLRQDAPDEIERRRGTEGWRTW